jgi:hypothetical protein
VLTTDADAAERESGVMVPEGPGMDEMLEEGLARLRERPTWKVWSCPVDMSEFDDADAFRTHLQVRHGPTPGEREQGAGVAGSRGFRRAEEGGAVGWCLRGR